MKKIRKILLYVLLALVFLLIFRNQVEAGIATLFSTVSSNATSVAGDGAWSGSSGGGYNSYDTSWDSNASSDWDYEPESPTKSESLSAAVPANTKMIYTAEMDLESQEFDETSEAIARIVEEMGGWFESRRLSESSRRYLSCVIRVPVENFSTLLDRLAETAHVTDRREDGQDISEAYYDTEARLFTQQTKLERLQYLLSQAENMEDIITLETAISDTELEIEYLTGSLRRFDSLVGYSTVTIDLREVYRLSEDEVVPTTFLQRFGAALATGFRRGTENLEEFLIGFAENWMSLLLLILIAVAGVFLYRRWKKKKGNAPPPSDPPEPPQQ